MTCIKCVESQLVNNNVLQNNKRQYSRIYVWLCYLFFLQPLKAAYIKISRQFITYTSAFAIVMGRLQLSSNSTKGANKQGNKETLLIYMRRHFSNLHKKSVADTNFDLVQQNDVSECIRLQIVYNLVKMSTLTCNTNWGGVGECAQIQTKLFIQCNPETQNTLVVVNLRDRCI